MKTDSDGVVSFAPFVRSPHNYSFDEASVVHGLHCPEPSLAQQHLAADTDINEIVRKFGLTGELPTNIAMPQSGDFTGVNDYQTALNMVLAAEASFMALSGPVRARFGHDPQAFVQFCDDPANHEEAEKLGLLVPKVTAAPIDVRVTTDAPAKEQVST